MLLYVLVIYTHIIYLMGQNWMHALAAGVMTVPCAEKLQGAILEVY